MAEFLIKVDTFKLPDHTEEQLEEWVRFQIGDRGSMSLDNPLSDYDLDAKLIEWSPR